LGRFLAGSAQTNETQRELLTTVRKYHYLTRASPTAGGRLKPNPTGALQRDVLPADRLCPHPLLRPATWLHKSSRDGKTVH